MATAGSPDPGRSTTLLIPTVLLLKSRPANSLVDLGISHVSWQTAYWTLIPLAINTMSQPSGRVCGLPSKHCTYLRCCPLLCAADSLSIFIHLTLFSAAFPFKDGVRLLIHYRFDDNKDNDNEGGDIRAIQKLTFIRWMFFVFGTLGPGIKLMAMEGVPWTKAWGVMFLLSFVMVEALVILSWNLGICEAVPEAHNEETLQRIKSKLSETNQVFLNITAFLYVLLLLWVVLDIHEGFHPFSILADLDSGPFMQTTFGFYVLLFEGVFLPIIIFCAVCFIIWLFSFLRDFMAAVGWKSGIKASLALCAYISLILELVGLGYFCVTVELVKVVVVDWCFLIALVALVLLGFKGLELMASSFPKLARTVLITFPKLEERGRTGDRIEDQEALAYLCFMTFLYPTVLCVIWYAYRYDPEGTVNRGWTGVFG
jgi:hypothetical protein